METSNFSRITHYTVSVFILDKKRILLFCFLKQSQSPYWLLPSGHIEDNELLRKAGVREVLEETGLKIELLQKPSEKAKTKIKKSKNTSCLFGLKNAFISSSLR